MYINIPSEDSVFPLLNSYIELKFEVIKITDNSIYANGDDIKLFKLGPIAICSNFKTSSSQHLEVFDHAHIVSLMYKLITRAKDTDDLSIDFHRDRNRG